MNDFEKEALEQHNMYRKMHGVPPLTFSEEIAKTAREWAESLAKNGKLSHSENSEYGENIASGSGSGDYDMSGKEVTDLWYKDINKYDFDEPVWGAGGHFTQMVWKGSSEFGIGKVKNEDGQVYIVANYLPPGNVKDQYEENVFQASGDDVVPVDGPEDNKSKNTGPIYCDECKKQVTCFYETKDGRTLCTQDYKKQAPKCAACDDPVIGHIITAMEQQWHAKCFVCTECKKPFDGPFYQKEGKSFCKEDYEVLYMGGKKKPETCYGCNEKIDTKWVNALGQSWHGECFKCKGCDTPLEGESFYKKDNNPYCTKCI